MTSQPDEAYLQGKSTELATFSMAKFLMEPKGPRQVGQQVSLGRQLEHTWKGMDESGEMFLKCHQLTKHQSFFHFLNGYVYISM